MPFDDSNPDLRTILNMVIRRLESIEERLDRIAMERAQQMVTPQQLMTMTLIALLVVVVVVGVVYLGGRIGG